MKRSAFSFIALLAIALILTACATPGERSAEDDGVVRVQSNLDHERIQAINNAASHTGARVIWVNPPRQSERDQRQ